MRQSNKLSKCLSKPALTITVYFVSCFCTSVVQSPNLVTVTRWPSWKRFQAAIFEVQLLSTVLEWERQKILIFLRLCIKNTFQINNKSGKNSITHLTFFFLAQLCNKITHSTLCCAHTTTISIKTQKNRRWNFFHLMNGKSANS